MKKTLCMLTASLVTGLLATVPTTPAEARGSMSLRVASFNVQSLVVDRTDGNRRPWRDRRASVVAQIAAEHPDVVGLQEANAQPFFRSRTVDGKSQVMDLVNGLNDRGANYGLTSYAAFNCVNPDTSTNCRYRWRAASHDNRVMYDRDKLTLLKRGALKYKHQGKSFKSFLPWGLFETKATGARFLFFSTHLTTGDAGVRRAQWWEMITRINQLRNTYDVPVIAVGDFNTHKFSDLGDDMLRAMRNNGYGDVTGQEGWTNRLDHQRAGRMVNGWINSWNRLDRNVRHYSYYDDRDRAGNMIDWIFATNRLDVSEFKQTIDYGNDLQVDGVFPSDHNMIRATITLP